MSSLALFEDRQVRRVFHQDEWWFVLTDIVLALTDSANPSDYLKKLRRCDPSLATAFKGGDKLSPPFTPLRNRRGKAKAAMLERSRSSPPDSVHPIAARGAI
jgi:hypothetical protein